MMNKQARELYENCAHIARTTEIPSTAEKRMNQMQGMIDYALLCGDLKPEHHANEYRAIQLIRAERAQQVTA